VSTTHTRRRLPPEQRRAQLLDAANDLFAEWGYEEVSVEDIARAAGVQRGLVHHYFGGRTDVYLALLERLDAGRDEPLRRPEGRSARARVADSVSRWLDWTEAHRSTYLGTIAPGDDIADPEVRRVVADLRSRAVAQLATFHADIADDSPRLRYALECWTGLNRTATRRWLRGEATREATHELLAVTLEHTLRTFGTPPSGRTSPTTRSRTP
jgi:AcrR family transcriptional regulator